MNSEGWLRKREAYLLPFRRLLGGSTQASPEVIQAVEGAGGVDAMIARSLRDSGISVDRLVLRHPLSGQEIGLGVAGKDLGQHLSTLETAVARVDADNDGDPEKAFLELWRCLRQRIEEVEQGKNHEESLGGAWDLLPGDSLLPDHTVWDRASAASALVSAMPKPAILIFTIASVQSVIGTARRMQDYWMGSYMISYLMWQAMLPIVEELGPDAVVLPDLWGHGLADVWLKGKGISIENPDPQLLMVAGFPNIFTAIVPEDQAEDLAKRAAKQVQDTVKDLFQSVRAYVEKAISADSANVMEKAQELSGRFARAQDAEAFRNGVEGLVSDSRSGANTLWKPIWDRQLQGFLTEQVFWVVLPWGTTDDEALSKYNRLLSRRVEENKERISPALLLEQTAGLTQTDLKATLGAGYSLVGALAGRLLQARKQVRSFSQVNEPGLKCTQCGWREALHPFSPFAMPSLASVGPFWDLLGQVNPRQSEGKLVARIRKGDRLCSPCLARRLAWEAFFLGLDDFKSAGMKRQDYHVLFPSTATAATARWKATLIQKAQSNAALADALKQYVASMNAFDNTGKFPIKGYGTGLLRALAGEVADADLRRASAEFARIDGEWLYPEALQEASDELGLLEQDVAQTCKSLLDEARNQGMEPPSHYYAVIYTDGDRMGEWVAGRAGPGWRQALHPDAEGAFLDLVGRGLAGKVRPLGLAQHKALGAALRNFVVYVARQTVEEEYAGRLIYAGGDDLRAFVPVQDLLPVLRALNHRFRGQAPENSHLLQPWLPDGDTGVLRSDRRAVILAGTRWHADTAGVEDVQNGITSKAGVVIVHESHPLYDVMERADEAEQKAKREGGRDAFCIALLRRSGDENVFVSRWQIPSLRLAAAGHETDVLGAVDGLVKAFDGGLSPGIMDQMEKLAAGLASLEVDAQEKVWRFLLGRHADRRVDKQALAQRLAHLLHSWEMERRDRRSRDRRSKELMPGWDYLTSAAALAEWLARHRDGN